MNKLTYVFIMAVVLFMWSGITNAHADCDNPCGALALIQCAAEAEKMEAEEFYNKVLFDSESVLDGFCKQPYSGKTGQQKYYYDNFCSKQAGGYYSYENFKKALDSGYFKEFCCAENTTKEERYKELANFLATVASETTSAVYDHKNDGFYWRYENGTLTGETMNDRTGNYYPADDWEVAAFSSDKDLINTQVYWGSVNKNEANVLTPATSPMGFAWGPIKVPENYTKIKMNQMIEPGYWCGMGATQLTLDTMVGFFGWYHNNIVDPPVANANYKEFVNNYLVDGEVGFMGALWYWMYRVSGGGFRTPHQAVTNADKPVCQDIACATMMINGGCNDYTENRRIYYEYFIQKLLGSDYKIKHVEQAFGGQTLENMTCPFDAVAARDQRPQPQEYVDYINTFLGYCRPQ